MQITGYNNIDPGTKDEVLDAKDTVDYMRRKGITTDLRAGM
jgi:hypothetical protein